ncbi:MAG: hypothetical protein HUJ93_08885, partial [Bacteroidales bacterium]|nr:hypothetical protein [Bacteroidales bacterium]
MKKFLLLIIICIVPLSVAAKKKKKSEQIVEAKQERTLTAEQQAHFDALYFDAIARQQFGTTAEAFALMQRALEIDSLSAPALYYMSDAYRLMDKPNQALIYIRRAVAADKSNSYWYSDGEGQLLMQMGRLDEAVVCYQGLAERFPQKSEPLYSLADIFLRLDSLSLCLDIIEKIEELDGVSSQLTLQKFYIMQQQGRSEEAFAEYDKLIKRFPYDISYRLQKGDLQMKNGQIPLAKETYDEAASIDPDNAYVWVALSNYYNIMGDFEKGDSLVQRALI